MPTQTVHAKGENSGKAQYQDEHGNRGGRLFQVHAQLFASNLLRRDGGEYHLQDVTSPSPVSKQKLTKGIFLPKALATPP